MTNYIALFSLFIANSNESIVIEGRFQNQQSVVITLDELETNEIPDEIEELINITEVKVQKTRPQHKWVTYPPLSWYERRELKAPLYASKINFQIRVTFHLHLLYLPYCLLNH